MAEIMLVLIFIAGYSLIAFEHHIRINKAAIALLTAAVLWVVVVFLLGNGVHEHFSHHLQGASQIVFFLMGAMTIVQLMEAHDGFKLVAALIRVGNKRALLWVVSLITFFLSAVLDNLTTSIVMTTLLFRLVSDKSERLIFASMIIIAANAGGAWSPIGDVTTTMLWISGQISSWETIKWLFVPSLVAVVVPLLCFSSSIKPEPCAFVADGLQESSLETWRVFLTGMGALLFVPVFKSITGLPPVVGVLLGLGVLWVLTDYMHDHAQTHLKAPSALSRIDHASVLFFLGILLAVGALGAAGFLARFSMWLDHRFGNLDVVAVVLGLLSAIVDNVPLTAATIGMYDLVKYPMDHKLWQLLAYAVGTGGSILVIGSAAGVVVMGLAGINFFWYLRRVSFIALLGYLSGVAAFLLMHNFGH